jgi:hypothetical protein
MQHRMTTQFLCGGNKSLGSFVHVFLTFLRTRNFLRTRRVQALLCLQEAARLISSPIKSLIPMDNVNLIQWPAPTLLLLPLLLLLLCRRRCPIQTQTLPQLLPLRPIPASLGDRLKVALPLDLANPLQTNLAQSAFHPEALDFVNAMLRPLSHLIAVTPCLIVQPNAPCVNAFLSQLSLRVPSLLKLNGCNNLWVQKPLMQVYAIFNLLTQNGIPGLTSSHRVANWISRPQSLTWKSKSMLLMHRCAVLLDVLSMEPRGPTSRPANPRA